MTSSGRSPLIEYATTGDDVTYKIERQPSTARIATTPREASPKKMPRGAAGFGTARQDPRLGGLSVILVADLERVQVVHQIALLRRAERAERRCGRRPLAERPAVVVPNRRGDVAGAAVVELEVPRAEPPQRRRPHEPGGSHRVAVVEADLIGGR